MLTITALAERAMLHMRADYGLSFDAKPVEVQQAADVTAPGALA